MFKIDDKISEIDSIEEEVTAYKLEYRWTPALKGSNVR
jgi:hypothetical protein